MGLIRKQIKIARQFAGLTQAELASVLGIKQATVSKYEKGEIIPSVERLEKILDVLGYELQIVPKHNNPEGRALPDPARL